jgi:type 1 glutamine amidotransferase
MRKITLLLTVLLAAALLFQAGAAAAQTRKHVVFVLGDHEYSGEETLPHLAAELEKNYALKCTVLKAFPDQNAEENIPGLETLRNADLAVFYLRWRRLPADQVAHIETYLKSGKPVLAYRTSSHSFNYPKDHPLADWNKVAAAAFGAPPGWGADGHTHYGHHCETDVSVIQTNASHPILKGIRGPFHVRSWLYHVLPKWPPPDATCLLLGKAVNPSRAAEDNPVAWAWKNKWGARAFYTSLGHPEDFKAEQLQRLSVNAIHWCLGLPSPEWKGSFQMDAPYRGMVSSKPKPAAKD